MRAVCLEPGKVDESVPCFTTLRRRQCASGGFRTLVFIFLGPVLNSSRFQRMVFAFTVLS